MTAHPITYLPLPNGAQFIFTPCPGTKESSLEAAVNTLATAGAKAVITVLPDEEIQTLDVSDLGKQIIHSGMQWFQLPIEDGQSPGSLFLSTFSAVKNELVTLLKNKSTIAIHCRGGSGRTGLLAAILLLELGVDWRSTKSLVQSARPNALTLDAHTHFLETHYAIRTNHDN